MFNLLKKVARFLLTANKNLLRRYLIKPLSKPQTQELATITQMLKQDPDNPANIARFCQLTLKQGEDVIRQLEYVNIPVATSFPCLNSRPLFFVHIPKTAGASVQQFLDCQFDIKDIYPGWNPPDLTDKEVAQHFLLFRGHFPAGQLAYAPPNTELFTILRKPENQIYSFYAWMKTLDSTYWETANNSARQNGASLVTRKFGRDLAEAGMEAAKTQSFTEFLQQDDLVSRSFTENISMRFLSDLGDPNSPANGIHRSLMNNGDEDSRLALAVSARRNLNNCMITGIFEQLDLTLLILCWKRGWAAPDVLPKIHSNRENAIEDPIDSATSILIREKTSIDTELYSIANKLLEKDWNILVAASGGVERVRGFLDTEHRKQFFSHSPSAVAIDLSAGCAWPGIGWGLRERNEHGQTWRWMGVTGKSSLLMSLKTSSQYLFSALIHTVADSQVLDSLQTKIDDFMLQPAGRGEYKGYPAFHWLIPSDIVVKYSGQIGVELLIDSASYEGRAIAFSRFICHPW